VCACNNAKQCLRRPIGHQPHGVGRVIHPARDAIAATQIRHLG
jgi:hypothetical protein